MKAFLVSVALAFSAGLELSPLQASVGVQGPDLSGRWNRDPAGRSGSSVDSATWGSQVEISQSGSNVIVRPSPGKPERYRLDGTEMAEVISVDGCRNKTRITKAVTSREKVTITTWLVTKAACFHGEDEDDPLVSRLGAVEIGRIRGPRRLESITVVYRDGDALTVETTRAAAGGGATTTTTTYRKEDAAPLACLWLLCQSCEDAPSAEWARKGRGAFVAANR